MLTLLILTGAGAAVQVTQYAQRFNLSASLAASISRYSAWVSSALLLALFSVVGLYINTPSTAHDMASISSLISAVRWPVTAVAAVAAAMLVISVPVSAKLASKSRSQGAQRTQSMPPGNANAAAEDATSAGGGVDSAAAHATVEGPEEEPSEDTISPPSTLPDTQSSPTGDSTNVGTPGLGLDSNTRKGSTDTDSNSGDVDSSGGDVSSAAVHATVEGPEEEPSEDTISPPSTLPDSQSSPTGGSTNVGTPGLGPGSNTRKGSNGNDESQSDGQSPKQGSEDVAPLGEAQPPAKDSGSSSAFFRDIETGCLPESKQRRVPLHPMHLRLTDVRHARRRTPVHMQMNVSHVMRRCSISTANSSVQVWT